MIMWEINDSLNDLVRNCEKPDLRTLLSKPRKTDSTIQLIQWVGDFSKIKFAIVLK